MQLLRESVVSLLGLSQEFVLLFQLFPFELGSFGELRDLFLPSGDPLLKLVEPSDYSNVVNELLTVAMDLLESECLIDGPEIYLLFGPSLEVQVREL